MDFIATLPTYGTDFAAKTVWSWFNALLRDADGTAYYKHPIVGTDGNAKPDLAIICATYHPIVLRCVGLQLADILETGAETWVVNEGGEDREWPAPDAEIEEFQFLLQQRFDKERLLRGRLSVGAFLALPALPRAGFVSRFGAVPRAAIWQEGDATNCLIPIDPPLTTEQWRLARSVMQATVPMRRQAGVLPRSAQKMGDAVKMLDTAIAVLDIEQEKVATQIPPGAQRIRGLAGTGKTVLLAMKAANIHRHLPNQKILFTFYTQSLYNQVRNLISKFYRFYSDVDPNWDVLHVRHAWGGRSKLGVYSDLCARQGQIPLDLAGAKSVDRARPFRACCEHALANKIKPEYDYILVDEAQDFPPEFFRILLGLSRAPHCVYFAYDELQNIFSPDLPDPGELFGRDASGQPIIDFEGTYDGGIEKDFVLHRSYRCPLEVLMLAHGLGLGIHGEHGPVQMLGSVDSWRSTGYEVETDALVTGLPAVIRRPKENSPNPIEGIYTGTEPLIVTKTFDDRPSELKWVARSVIKNIQEEGIAPDQIIVISLNARVAKKYMVEVQSQLLEEGIPSTIPGLIDSSAEFGEPGKVTLATVSRAKGNEAPIVYILAFDEIYNYVEEIEHRNMAFTAISRSKGWVRISGTGVNMKRAEKEMSRILNDVPFFRFTFPDLEKIRNLDAEVSRRRKEAQKAKQAAQQLSNSELEAVRSLDPELKTRLLRSLLTDSVSEADLKKLLQRLKSSK